ncbi:preprotein translocase subunit SecE [Lachnospiraceae bacterium]|nr:preprotein translocase subunit SecE [Lachnospiraceae bacterium]
MADKKDTSPALKRSWFQELKIEFGKITWPGKAMLAKETGVVLITAVLLGGLIVVVDWLLNLALQFLW